MSTFFKLFIRFQLTRFTKHIKNGNRKCFWIINSPTIFCNIHRQIMVSYLNVVNYFLHALWNHTVEWYSCLLKTTNYTRDYVQHLLYCQKFEYTTQHNEKEGEGHKVIPDHQLECHLLLKLFPKNLLLDDLIQENK